MRESVINISSHQVILEDKSQFNYTVSPFELRNSLGNLIAILQEYNFTRNDVNENRFCCKLYRTKEGNWYETDEGKMSNDKTVIRMLKTAVDKQEGSYSKVI